MALEGKFFSSFLGSPEQNAEDYRYFQRRYFRDLRASEEKSIVELLHDYDQAKGLQDILAIYPEAFFEAKEKVYLQGELLKVIDELRDRVRLSLKIRSGPDERTKKLNELLTRGKQITDSDESIDWWFRKKDNLRAALETAFISMSADKRKMKAKVLEEASNWYNDNLQLSLDPSVKESHVYHIISNWFKQCILYEIFLLYTYDVHVKSSQLKEGKIPVEPRNEKCRLVDEAERFYPDCRKKVDGSRYWLASLHLEIRNDVYEISEKKGPSGSDKLIAKDDLVGYHQMMLWVDNELKTVFLFDPVGTTDYIRICNNLIRKWIGSHFPGYRYDKPECDVAIQEKAHNQSCYLITLLKFISKITNQEQYLNRLISDLSGDDINLLLARFGRYVEDRLFQEGLFLNQLAYKAADLWLRDSVKKDNEREIAEALSVREEIFRRMIEGLSVYPLLKQIKHPMRYLPYWDDAMEDLEALTVIESLEDRFPEIKALKQQRHDAMFESLASTNRVERRKLREHKNIERQDYNDQKILEYFTKVLEVAEDILPEEEFARLASLVAKRSAG